MGGVPNFYVLEGEMKLREVFTEVTMCQVWKDKKEINGPRK